MKKIKNNVIFILLLTILILYFVFKDDFSGIMNALSKSNLVYILLILIVMIICEFIKSLALYYIIKDDKKDYKLKSAFSLAIKTNFFNGITPFSLGGQPFELYILNSKDDIDYVTGTNILFKDFYAYQIALVILAIICLIINSIFNIVVFDSIMSKLMIIGFIMNLSIALFLVYLPYSKGNLHNATSFIIKLLNKIGIIKDKESTISKVDSWINEFKVKINNIRSNPKLIIRCILLYMLRFIPLGIATSLSIYAIGIYNVGFVKPILIMHLIMTMSSFVPIPGASGGMEYGFISMFSSYINGSNLTASMLIWRFATYYLLLIMGALLVVFDRKKVK